MITSHDQRLGRNSADEIKSHPFFAGVDWNTIRNIESPFIPQLRSLTDTSYFPTEDLGDVPEQPTGSEGTSGSKDLAFLGYTVRTSLMLSTFSIESELRALSCSSSDATKVLRTIRLGNANYSGARSSCFSIPHFFLSPSSPHVYPFPILSPPPSTGSTRTDTHLLSLSLSQFVLFFTLQQMTARHVSIPFSTSCTTCVLLPSYSFAHVVEVRALRGRFSPRTRKRGSCFCR